MAVKQIEKSQLVAGNWHAGRGRNGNVGRWEGDCFSVLNNDGEQASKKIEFKNHCDLKGSFRSLLLVNEGEVIEPYIESGRKHLV